MKQHSRFRGRSAALVALVLWSPFASAIEAASDPPKTVDFAYFLDDFESEVANVPHGVMAIGNTGMRARQAQTTEGRIVGMTLKFHPRGSNLCWNNQLKKLFNNPTPPDISTPEARRALATEIMQAAGIDLSRFPEASEATPNPTSGGYVAWTQDFEMANGISRPEVAAAMLAVSWAGRVLLTPDSRGYEMQIVPVPGSAIQKATSAEWRLSDVVAGTSRDKYVSYLELEQTLSVGDRSALAANRIDLLSMMYLATAESRPLIDGFLAEQYSTSIVNGQRVLNCEALPGSFSQDTPQPYAAGIPFAIMSSMDAPAQLLLPPGPDCPSDLPPFDSSYRGSLPMRSGIYWGAVVDPSFDPAHYLTPTVVADDGACAEDLDHNGVVGAGDLGRLLGAWNSPTADLDGDGTTDVNDLSLLLEAWGASCETGLANSWIKVLVAQDPPPGAPGAATYVQKIQKLAPNLKQIHLRWPAGSDPSLHQHYADVIQMLRDAYGGSLLVGFHPDNAKHTSCIPWGCTQGDCDPTSSATWQCVLDESIKTMNAINAIADPNQAGTGFNIFSIEQSYVENVEHFLAEIKHCLAGDSTALPAVTPADPPVKFANVTGSYGGPETYGPNGYDFTYPQYYGNLAKHLPPDATVLYQGPDPYFPAASAQSCLPREATDIWVVDADVSGAYRQPKIPCFTNTPNVYATTATGAPGASPDLAAAYVAFLLTQYPPISNQIELGTSKVYITFSGESADPEFLGGSGWTLDLINQFHANLQANFIQLKTLVPTLFPDAGADPTTIEFAIWNFDSILGNMP
jgi:hypothetical protein